MTIHISVKEIGQILLDSIIECQKLARKLFKIFQILYLYMYMLYEGLSIFQGISVTIVAGNKGFSLISTQLFNVFLFA